MSTNNNHSAGISYEQEIYQIDPEEDTILKDSSVNTQSVKVLLDVVKQLKPGSEIYKLSLPSYLLQPISFLEKMSIYSTPTSILIPLLKYCESSSSSHHSKVNYGEKEGNLDEFPSPSRQCHRMVLIVSWLVSIWRSVPRLGIAHAKPYNPILGEQFHCKWEFQQDDPTLKSNEQMTSTGNSNPATSAEFFAEQVSHHPPITAFLMRNLSKTFCYRGHIYPKTKFSLNSFTTVMDGRFHVELKLPNGEKEIYTIHHPNVVCSGIVFGTTQIRISGEMTITCDNKAFQSRIKFSSDNRLEGTIDKHLGNHKWKSVYKITGKVNQVVTIKDLDSQNERVLYDCSTITKPLRIVAPLSLQKEHESQRNWHNVTLAIRKGNYEESNREKQIIEDRERKIRKQNIKNNLQLQPQWFQLQKQGSIDEWIFCDGE